jgi:biofilm PGA synthesis N-glycosyltransferase PgaC
MTTLTAYALISPCRNEADYMRETLDTVVAQSVTPTLWVIVDDGSSDTTPAMLPGIRGFASSRARIVAIAPSARA